jgi:hypothetical protein
MHTRTEPEPAAANLDRDDLALEEIRELFARYRRLARRGAVTERDEPSAERSDRAGDAPADRPDP